MVRGYTVILPQQQIVASQTVRQHIFFKCQIVRRIRGLGFRIMRLFHEPVPFRSKHKQCFADDLADGGVREDNLVQALGGGLGVDHRRRAVDHLGGVAADDVHADELTLLDIIDELAEAVAHGVIS